MRGPEGELSYRARLAPRRRGLAWRAGRGGLPSMADRVERVRG